jgi:hypothetical protein
MVMLASTLAAAVLAVPAAAQAPAPAVTTVVSGLDNPRDLAFGPNGELYVAEAGRGGPKCVKGGPEGATCLGFTSGISRIDLATSTARRIVSGLMSVSDKGGSAATGVDGISVLPDGQLYGIITGATGLVAQLPPGKFSAKAIAKGKRQAGRLIRVSPGGKVRFGANVGAASFAWTAAHKRKVRGQFPDANPYGVFATAGAQWVVDAGANTINRVVNGKVKVVKFIPNPPASDAVPTCIDRGPDGAFYIGELTGGGNKPGASRVWRFTPSGNKLTQWATGLTAVTGCGFAPDGQFYATEFSTRGLDKAAPGTGAVVRVAPNSTAPTTVVGNLNFPGGFAAGSDGSLYVSNWSIAPGKAGANKPTGEVVRIAAPAS